MVIVEENQEEVAPTRLEELEVIEKGEGAAPLTNEERTELEALRAEVPAEAEEEGNKEESV